MKTLANKFRIYLRKFTRQRLMSFEMMLKSSDFCVLLYYPTPRVLRMNKRTSFLTCFSLDNGWNSLLLRCNSFFPRSVVKHWDNLRYMTDEEKKTKLVRGFSPRNNVSVVWFTFDNVVLNIRERERREKQKRYQYKWYMTDELRLKK